MIGYRVLVVLALVLSASALAEECEIRGSANPRQIDIQFPNGHLVSVAGHIHPPRGGDFKPEFQIQDFLVLPIKEMSGYLHEHPKFAERVSQALRDNRTAARDYAEEHLQLARELKNKRHQFVGLETLPIGLKWYQDNAQKMKEHLPLALKLLKVPNTQKQAFTLYALQPSFLLKSENPKLFRNVEIFTAEPEGTEAAKYEHDVCASGATAVVPAVAAMTVPAPVSRIYKYFGSEDPQKDFTGCSGRDALLAQNLARKAVDGDVIDYLGYGHLPALAYYLKRECLARHASNTESRQSEASH